MSFQVKSRFGSVSYAFASLFIMRTSTTATKLLLLLFFITVPSWSQNQSSLLSDKWSFVKRAGVDHYSFSKNGKKITTSYVRRGYTRSNIVCPYIINGNSIRVSYLMPDFPYGKTRADAVFTADLFLSATKDQLIVHLIRMKFTSKKMRKPQFVYPKNYYFALDRAAKQ